MRATDDSVADLLPLLSGFQCPGEPRTSSRRWRFGCSLCLEGDSADERFPRAASRTSLPCTWQRETGAKGGKVRKGTQRGCTRGGQKGWRMSAKMAGSKSEGCRASALSCGGFLWALREEVRHPNVAPGHGLELILPFGACFAP